MKFRPLHDRVVVRRIEEDTKTKGGIIIPDTAKEKLMQGEVSWRKIQAVATRMANQRREILRAWTSEPHRLA